MVVLVVGGRVCGYVSGGDVVSDAFAMVYRRQKVLKAAANQRLRTAISVKMYNSRYNSDRRNSNLCKLF